MDGSSMNYTIAADELRAGIERVEQIRSEIADLKEQEKEVFSEYKGRGYMTRPMRTLIKLRAEDPAKRAENEAILDLYKTALGME